MRLSRGKVFEIGTVVDIGLLTPRQMEFLNFLRADGGMVPRSELFWRFGTGVDGVACALIQKGLVERVRQGGKIYYRLVKKNIKEKGGRNGVTK